MPLGLSNAPRTFRRIMQKILGHLSMVKLYLDDILIFSKHHKSMNMRYKLFSKSSEPIILKLTKKRVNSE